MNRIFLKHRVNSLQEISKLDKDWGVEIDLRSCVTKKGSLHLSHDAWSLGDDFEMWLAEFKKQEIQGPIWLNTKEDGLEERIEELMADYGIKNYVFLDTVLPTLVKKTHFQNYRHYAVRFSFYEPKEFVSCFKRKADWVWADCFQGIPVSVDKVKELKEYFKVCLVSPELHGKSLKENIKAFQPIFELADAVCSKEPHLWKFI